MWQELSYEEMYMIGTPKTDDSESRMNTYSMLGSTTCSLAKEFKHLWEELMVWRDIVNIRRGKEVKQL